MAAVRIQDFAGMMPKIDPRRLPINYAEESYNMSTGDGRLEPFNQSAQLVDLSATPDTIRRIYRYEIADEEIWLGFTDTAVDLVDGPLVNDEYTRKYYTDGSYARYNTIDRIKNGDEFYLLGVPSPEFAFTVTPQATGTLDDETRAYIVTFVSEYGEEGSPSEPVIATGDPNQQWVLTNLPVDDVGLRSITKKRIYRTVTGAVTAEYYFITDLDFAETSFVDTVTNEEAVRNDICDSFNYEPPPDNLLGIVEHPQGFLVAFWNNTLYLSEPYKPHAWPREYSISMHNEIRGLAVVGNTIVVGTVSTPLTVTGTRPDELSVQEFNVSEPCLNRRSMIPFDNTVVYASSNGLVAVTAGGVENVTYRIMDKHFWQANFEPEIINAVRSRRGHYVALTSAQQGFVINPFDEKLAVTYISYDDPITAFQEDNTSSETFLVQNNIVFQWDPWYTDVTVYDWLSKQFDLERPLNLSYAHIKLTGGGPIDSSANVPLGQIYEDYNVERIQYPLGPLGFAALGASKKLQLTSPVSQTKQPLGGRVLYNLSGLEQTKFVTIQVYVDGKLQYIASVNKDTKFRLPSGFKGTVWQFRLSGNAKVYSIAFASTGKELATV